MNSTVIAIAVGGFFYLLSKPGTGTSGNASDSALAQYLTALQNKLQQSSGSKSGGSGGGGSKSAPQTPSGSGGKSVPSKTLAQLIAAASTANQTQLDTQNPQITDFLDSAASSDFPYANFDTWTGGGGGGDLTEVITTEQGGGFTLDGDE